MQPFVRYKMRQSRRGNAQLGPNTAGARAFKPDIASPSSVSNTTQTACRSGSISRCQSQSTSARLATPVRSGRSPRFNDRRPMRDRSDCKTSKRRNDNRLIVQASFRVPKTTHCAVQHRLWQRLIRIADMEMRVFSRACSGDDACQKPAVPDRPI